MVVMQGVNMVLAQGGNMVLAQGVNMILEDPGLSLYSFFLSCLVPPGW